MKASLVLKMGQQLSMTPQLQQAIRLLQMSTLDLQEEIQEALDSNPMLEREEDGEHANAASPPVDNSHGGQSAGEDDAANSTEKQQDSTDWTEQIPNELEIDTSWDDIYQSSASTLPSSNSEEWDASSTSSAGVDLQTHLLWQLNLAKMTDSDRMIATVIIDSIGNDGYLQESLDEILASFDPMQHIELDEVEMVLKRVQQFEPTGIAARNLSECLLLQLQHLPSHTPWLSEAKVLCKDHLELLGSRDYSQLMRRLRLKEDALKEVVQLIQSLNPRPGSLIESQEPEYIVPDVIVRKANNRWIVELNPEIAPRLSVNAQYASFIQRADNSADNTFLRTQLQEARWFIKSLQSRNETLLKVATQILDYQRGFFDYGPEAMKPLVLADIAEVVGMHESTISRVTTQKYMHTPRGIFELKYFFSSHVNTTEGGECSSTAIRAIISKLVAAENPKKPLSDSKIAALLEEQGIQVARRTIAKYRESLGIASSTERKQLL
ncbi:MAG: RNA polymerase factor sigma-54 [Pseudomonas sp.]|jgi:RNA polymerase sigma-54 factor|nr:RNA polymerase factor sigma-54 [Pseudomonas sp.]MDD2221946.1 RNA polymerase factor sigma-54 [Pseudomonas sp.]MDY0413284.1 RNA polymerase factor sigma-54 [Pseudomonas sp.]NLO53032.1 RNA polymerase factor sigma-54 [Gammaproteobacteria bacterium]